MAGFASATSSNWGRAFKFQNWPGVAPAVRWVIDGPILKLERPTPDQTCAPVRGRLSYWDFSGLLGSLGFCWAAGGWSGCDLSVLLGFVISRGALGGCRTEAAAEDFCELFAGGCWGSLAVGVHYVGKIWEDG